MSTLRNIFDAPVSEPIWDRNMTKSALTFHGLRHTALFALSVAITVPAAAQNVPREKIETLPAFIDTTVPKLMEERHAPGTAAVVVHDGRVILSKGYGKARLNPDVAVDASRTLFRIGSVTKLFTATAAVQLAEAGKLDLHRDVREYVPAIPLVYGATTHQLLTHTAGLDERFAGAYTDSPEYLQPLSEHLRRYIPEQVFRPGTASSYTNYGYALVELVIERVSGISYEEYIADRILRPLGMISSTAHQPPPSNLAGDLARGYRWVDGRHEPIPYNYTQARPGGGMTATAADIGRFMVAVLGDGSIDGGRMLTPKFLEMMLAEQYKPHPFVPGTAYGFGHLLSHERRLLVSSGTLGDQSSSWCSFPKTGSESSSHATWCRALAIFCSNR